NEAPSAQLSERALAQPRWPREGGGAQLIHSQAGAKRTLDKSGSGWDHPANPGLDIGRSSSASGTRVSGYSDLRGPTRCRRPSQTTTGNTGAVINASHGWRNRGVPTAF